MTDYAVGDIQGCFEPLQRLLMQVNYDPAKDRLWLVGDLVNRGPDSLKVLRFVRALGDSAICVLGNHDLHLLAVAAGVRPLHHDDTLTEILEAEDCQQLLQWLSRQALAHYDAESGYCLVHAGIAPQWSLQQALELASEVERVLQGANALEFLSSMYGNNPDCWDDSLTGMARLRVITNYLTRLRFCDQNGRMDLTNKGGLDSAAKGFIPWFKVKREPLGANVLFGHWAALRGISTQPGIHALDTGCVWGQRLSLMRLEDQRWFHCSCA